MCCYLLPLFRLFLVVVTLTATISTITTIILLRRGRGLAAESDRGLSSRVRCKDLFAAVGNSSFLGVLLPRILLNPWHSCCKVEVSSKK